jgi:hypothetical protein
MAKVTVRGNDYDSVEVWADSNYEEALYGVSTHPRGSVLEGETSYSWLGPYDEFEVTYPGLGNNGRGRPPVPQMSHSAPSWFSEADAGESWGDDY